MFKALANLGCLVIFAVLLFMNGRYNVTVETGRPASGVVETQNVATWLTGLIPAKPVSGCRGQIARVQTKVTFLGSVISMVTFGIYTPVLVKISCATP